MSIERLEEIKQNVQRKNVHFKYLNSDKGFREDVYTLLEHDFKWLIEQAGLKEQYRKRASDLEVESREKIKNHRKRANLYEDALINLRREALLSSMEDHEKRLFLEIIDGALGCDK